MKFLLLKIAVMWRRFRYEKNVAQQMGDAPHIETLMHRAKPDQSWRERANWMIDVTEWIRHQSKVSLRDKATWQAIKHQRVTDILDWLDNHRDVRRLVQMTLQKTLRETQGPELFSMTGLSKRSVFFGELFERLTNRIMPKALVQTDTTTLFMAMFPDPEDAQWLLELDDATLGRLWRLVADEGVSHMYWQQVDDALLFLMTDVVAEGISPAFRHRLEPNMALKASPFLALRREMDKYLVSAVTDEGATRGIRMLIAVCRAQTDRIYNHLDENGVSMSLVYRIERMRSQLTRMGRLIDMRSCVVPGAIAGHVKALLSDMVSDYHTRGSVRGLFRRSFTLLGRKIVERNTGKGEHFVAQDAQGYRAIIKAGYLGGIVLGFIALLKYILLHTGWMTFTSEEETYFFEGLFVSAQYVLGFWMVSAIGGVLAAKQPAVTAPLLAAKMSDLDNADGMRGMVSEVMRLLRSQTAAVLGNVTASIPAAILVAWGFAMLAGESLMTGERAYEAMGSLSLFSLTPLYAIVTGVLLWLSSMIAGVVDNWFALHHLRDTLSQQRRLVYILGPVRAERWAAWCERRVALIAGNISLGVLFGMTPAVMHFFGLHLEIRHVTLALGKLMAAASSLGWHVLGTTEFWLAAAGIVVVCLLNVGVAFACALVLALRARNISARMRHLVYRRVFRQLISKPQTLFSLETGTGTRSSVSPAETGKGRK
jgi:site-specific recombinase